jgi:hypothetical protein
MSGQAMTELEQHANRVKDSLDQAVAEALEEKKKLGHYAVFWRDGKVVHSDLSEYEFRDGRVIEVETYSDERIAEFEQEDARLSEILKRKDTG